MNKSIILFLPLVFLFNQVDANDPSLAHEQKFVHRHAGNPYLPLWEHVPDGEPRVFEDPDNPGKYRIYIIGSHDVQYKAYCGFDTRVWSAPVDNLTAWRDDGPVFSHSTEGKSDVLYAPDLIELKNKNGKKEYYLYPHSRGPNREAMVAKGNRPDGPFTPINLTTDGKKTLPGSVMGFDPAVYIDYVTDPNDPDFDIGYRAYGYWGFRRSQAGELDPADLYSLRRGTELIDYFIPAGEKYGVIKDPEGTNYPYVFPGEDLGEFNFFEAASIRKIGNKYLWVYSGYSGPEYGLSSANATLRYAYGDSPLGPWKSGGVLVDARAPVLNKEGDKIVSSYSGHNTHGSVEQINDQWYVFYHRAPRSYGYARQAMVAPVIIDWDKKSVAEGGKVNITAFDPYGKEQTWFVKDKNGLAYNGAEVTSEGFHIYGLDPYQYYSAGYASYLSNTQIQEDSWDVWDNNMPLSNVENGNIIGYKYFGFGGLEKDTKGLKAFEGSKPGKQTALKLFLTPKTHKAFKVHVWLNGPWKNKTWRGKKMGEIHVPANANQTVSSFTLDVSKYVDRLEKKHALFLTAEGDSSEGLFDLIGLGFRSKDKDIERPVPPQVSILVNGQKLSLPDTPVRATPANGISGYGLYEVQHKLEDRRKLPEISAFSTNAEVNVDITQPHDGDEGAQVTFNYRGVIKTYRINFTK